MQHTCAHFFVVVLHDDNVKLPSYTFYVGNVVCVPVRSFFSTAAHFSLWWPLVFLSQSYHRYEKFIFFFWRNWSPLIVFISHASSFQLSTQVSTLKFSRKKYPSLLLLLFFFFLKVQPCDLPPKRAVLDMRNFTPAYMKGWTYVRTTLAQPKLLGCIDNQISYLWCFASRSLHARGHRYKYTSITQ